MWTLPCRTFVLARRAAMLTALIVGATTGAMAIPEANSCNATSDLIYPAATQFSTIGETVRVRVSLGAGTVTGGTMLVINRVRFDLACMSPSLSLHCVADPG